MSAQFPTNTTLDEIAEILKRSDNIVVAGHVCPDGDCIGSQLSLTCALRSLGKKVTPTLASNRTPPANLKMLPEFESLIYAGDFEGKVDLFVALDTPIRDRLDSDQCELLDAAHTSITIDHHSAVQRITDYAYVDPISASASMLVWRLIKLLGVNITPQMAQCAYVGIMTDTTSFRNQNTTIECFELAQQMVESGANPSKLATDVFLNRTEQSMKLEGLATTRMQFCANNQFVVSYITRRDMTDCNAKPEDSEIIVDTLRSVSGVRVACFLKEIIINGKIVIKGSLRAKDDTDVSIIAKKYEGGGHKGAAGFRMYGSIEQAINQICNEFESYLSDDAQSPSQVSNNAVHAE